ncbi:MAG: hypothetical protein HC906_18765 [Bacteroidales bacterium]|nr:hypothetical protein [Bacteroidales bacterium]
MLTTGKQLIAIILVFLALSGCKSKSEKEIVYSEEVAKMVSFVTAGNIKSDDIIQIRFNEPVVEANQVERVLPGKIFSFSPSIKGKALWKDRNTLIFRPEKTLTARKQFTGTVYLDDLSPDFKAKKLGKIQFRFFVSGRDIVSCNAELILKDRNNPKILQYFGTIVFTEKTSIDILKESAGLKGDGSSVPLNWKEINNTTFEFISGDLIRGDRSKDYSLRIDKNKLGLTEDYEREFEVTPLQDMKVVNVVKEEEGKSPRLRIEFSDEIELNQDVSAFFTISPEMEINVSKFGSSVVIDGDFRFGGKYTLNIAEGLMSRWGTKTKKKITEEIKFSDIPPQIEFASDGVILPTSNQKNCNFFQATSEECTSK